MFKQIIREWSVCKAAQEPKIIHPELPVEDKRLDLKNPIVLSAVLSCRKRTKMEGRYLNGACSGCVCKVRLNLESLG